MFINGYGELAMKEKSITIGGSTGASTPIKASASATNKEKLLINLKDASKIENYSLSGMRFLFHYEFVCSYDENHVYFLDMEVIQNKNKAEVRKVEQLASPYELMHTNNYDKLLKEMNALEDYRNSIATKANNYYVASFTYSRRVLEKILLYSYKNNKQLIDGFERNKSFRNKLDCVRNNIDPDLFDHFKPLYSVLSEAIHYLSDDECKQHFNTLHDLVTFQLEYMLNKSKNKKHKKHTIKTFQNIPK